jgi:predicted nucleic acid-binding protein
MMTPILIDASFLYTLYDLDDKERSNAIKFVNSYHSTKGIFLIPDVVLTEVSYLLRRRFGVHIAVLFLKGLSDPTFFYRQF